jgi:hypothetical protein
MRRLDRAWFVNCLRSLPFFSFIIFSFIIFLVFVCFDHIFIKMETRVQLNLLSGIIIISQNYNGMLLNESIRMSFINMGNLLFSHLILICCMSLLIPFQMAVIKNMVEKIRQNFKRIKFDKFDENINIDMNSRFQREFIHSNWYYALFLTIFFPFMVIFSYYYSIFYSREAEPNIIVLIFDIYNNFLDAASIFLFFFILWIIFNFTYSLREISLPPFNDLIILDPISTDNMGGLGPLKYFILNQILLYSICITIAVFSYIDARQFIFRYESYIFLFMLITGISSLIYSLISIQELLKYKKEKAIENINKLYINQNKKFNKIIFEGHNIADDSELNKISTIINEIKSEREIIMSMQANLIDLRTVGTVISSILLPIIIKMIESLVIHT